MNRVNVPFDRDEELEELRNRILRFVNELHDETSYALQLIYQIESHLAYFFKMENEV